MAQPPASANILKISLLLATLLAVGVTVLVPSHAARKTSFQQKPAAQDDEVVRINTELVVLNATVLDKSGKFISGLKRGDFHVFEDGKEQTILSFSAEETPFAAAVLLDTSGSMESRLSLGRGAAIRFLDGLRDEDVAAIYSFDAKVEQWQDFVSGRDLPPRVFNLHTRNLTALNDAVLRAAQDINKRAEKRKAILVLSDGGENSSRASADKALNLALQAGATIYTVNMSEEGPRRDIMGTGILQTFAEKSGGRYISAPGGQILRDSFAEIAEELSHQYTIAYRPSNSQHDGRWRAIAIKLSRPDGSLRTRKGYRAPKD